MLLFIALISTLVVLNPFWAQVLQIVGVSQRITLLRKLPISDFDFPRSQAVVAVSSVGVFTGLGAGSRVSKFIDFPIWVMPLLSLVTTWISFWITVMVIRLWLRQGDRWDGEENIFNLLAASWLVVGTLGFALIVLDIPLSVVFLFYCYTGWVGVNALSGTIPDTRLAHIAVGVSLALSAALLVSCLFLLLLAVFLARLGWNLPI